MNYEIVATLGPASATAKIWQALLAAGATAFRLNTSHLELPDLSAWLERMNDFHAKLAAPLPIILDLQGSKWRLGDFPTCRLEPGQMVRLVLAAQSGQPGVLPVPHADFFQAAATSSGEISLNDAKIRLVMERIDGDTLSARCVQGGEISSRKGVTYTASEHRVEQLSAKDRAIFEQTRHLHFVRYAISYIKDALEMARYRALFSGGCYIIAKLERQPAVDQAAEIAVHADELWLCRGDLGAELGMKEMAAATARFSEQVKNLPIPAILAGQVFEHMKESLTPTRSEVCYLYEVLQKGYHGVVLSDETAVGRYPVESCRAAGMFRG